MTDYLLVHGAVQGAWSWGQVWGYLTAPVEHPPRLYASRAADRVYPLDLPGHGADADGDKIPDQKEGCNPPRDTDGDKVPDYADTDADGDGIPDSVEGAGDSDGDKRPDFQDSDSDGDGIKDGDEDLNGDGKLGCCLSTCGEKRKGCPPVAANACGIGQKCAGGKCTPW